jgi:hypothetical protein
VTLITCRLWYAAFAERTAARSPPVARPSIARAEN